MDVGTHGTYTMTAAGADLVYRKWLITGPGTGTNPKPGDVLPVIADSWLPGIDPADVTPVGPWRHRRSLTARI